MEVATQLHEFNVFMLWELQPNFMNWIDFFLCYGSCNPTSWIFMLWELQPNFMNWMEFKNMFIVIVLVVFLNTVLHYDLSLRMRYITTVGMQLRVPRMKFLSGTKEARLSAR